MRPIRIAINGFGRIGRIAARIILEHKDLELIAINDLSDDIVLAQLFEFDSAQGRYKGEVKDTPHGISFNNHEVLTFAEKEPKNLPWGKLDIDIVIESSGFFTSSALAGKHIEAGAKRVILSAAPKSDDIPTYVLGVNGHLIDKDAKIISNASCTTNCLAPMIRVLEENYHIKSGIFITIHAYTNDQRLQDGPHSDLRRARAAAVNIIPTTTSAANALFKIYPHLQNKISGVADRVPVINGSLTEFICNTQKLPNVEALNQIFKTYAQQQLLGIMEYTEKPLVSSDVIGNPHSCVFDSGLTNVTGDLIKVTGWYDNEMGYSNRLVEMIELWASND